MSDALTDAAVAWPPEPRANPELAGHNKSERLLADAATSGRLHHGWLISGPKGIGKATLAYRFARWLLTGSAEEGEQSGLFGEPAAAETSQGALWVDPKDPIFLRVEASGHADLITVERGLDDAGKRLRTEILAADIRKVAGFLSLTAAEGGWRVVIVDGAEDMNRFAANAILKTLEEPPARTVLLLVSHAPGRLLPTIRSRCSKLPLKPLETETVSRLLDAYRPDLSADEKMLLAAMGEGSIGRAMNLAEAGGVALYGEMLNLLSSLPSPDTTRLHGITDAIARSRSDDGGYEAYNVFTELLLWWIARLVRASATSVLPPALAPGEDELMARLSATASLDQWVEVWEKITRLFGRAGRINLDRKQVLLNAFFALGRVGS
jgi:DNA polymerase-3 subunit delta'